MKANTRALNPLNYVINSKQFEEIECVTCMNKSINMFRCRTCKHYFCFQCASDQKMKSDRCPFRCSEGAFLLQEIAELKIQYRCPYSEECKQILRNKRELWQHDRYCKWITKSQKKQQQKKWKFVCVNDHFLQIDLSPFSIISKRKICSSCQFESICRVTCKKCDKYYCHFCRPLPVFDRKCPRNHEFQGKYFQSTNMACDCCQLAVNIVQKKIYNDFFCNFDICQNCFANYPRFEEPIHYIQNLNNYCDLGGNRYYLEQEKMNKEDHRLVILAQRVLTKCDLCVKNKLCYKRCQKCDKYYCINCKPFEILANYQCEFGHQFLLVDEDIQRNQSMIDCYLCGKKLAETNDINYVFDKSCHILFCADCSMLEYQQIELSMRNLSAKFGKCDLGHYLIFSFSKNKEKCTLCQKQWYSKMVCTNCMKYYCTICIAPKSIQMCYCGKVLQMKEKDTVEIFCERCGKQEEDVFYVCKPCYYSICKKCYQLGVEKDGIMAGLGVHLSKEINKESKEKVIKF